MSAVVCAALLLTACGAPKTRATKQGAAPTPPAAAAAAAYRIDSAHSEIRLLVYRAGPMALFGHNHVILNRSISGWAEPASGARPASFALRMPVANFIVDDAGARGDEGRDFSSAVAAEARSGTRSNMLSAALLDADRYSMITVTSAAVAAATAGARPGGLVATVAIEVAGHESRQVVPFTLEASADRLEASGTVSLRQSELGLTPFSVMLGALQVQDEFAVKFKLVAAKI